MLETSAVVDDVRQRTTLRTRLAAASEMLAGATAGDDSASSIGRALLAVTEAPRAAVFLRSPNGVVTCPWFHNLSDAYVRELHTPNGVNPWMHIIRHPELRCMDLPKGRRNIPEPSLVRDVRGWPSANADLIEWADREGLCSICSWPLSRAGRVIAAVACYYDEPHVCSSSEHDIMREFAHQASARIQAGSAAHTGLRNETGAAVRTARLAPAPPAFNRGTPRVSDAQRGLRSSSRLPDSPRERST